MVQNIVIILEEAVDTAQETVKQPVKDTKDRKLVQAHLEQVSKVVRCHYTDVFQREVS